MELTPEGIPQIHCWIMIFPLHALKFWRYTNCFQTHPMVISRVWCSHQTDACLTLFHDTKLFQVYQLCPARSPRRIMHHSIQLGVGPCGVSMAPWSPSCCGKEFKYSQVYKAYFHVGFLEWSPSWATILISDTPSGSIHGIFILTFYLTASDKLYGTFYLTFYLTFY